MTQQHPLSLFVTLLRVYQGNISCKDGHNKGQKWYGPNRSRRYLEEVARIHRRTIQKDLHDPDYHDHSPRARHPEIQSQMGFRKHHYEQS